MASAARKRPSYSRPASPAGPGNQPGGRPGPRRGDNDNRAPRRADNDNQKPSKPRPPSRAPRRSGRSVWRRLRWVRRLARPLPYIGPALLALELLEQFYWELQEFDFGAEWSKICEVPDLPHNRMRSVSNNPGLACGTGGQVPGPLLSTNPSIPANHKWVATGPQTGTVVARMRLSAQWSRPAGTWKAVPWGKPAWLPTAAPQPFVDPMAIPLGVPSAHPRPVPYRQIPGRPKSDGYPEGSRRETPKPGPKPLLRIIPKKPYKERKFRSPGGLADRLLGAAGGLFAAATETQDFIDSLWKALPKDARTKNADMYEKLEDLYKNFDRLDVNEAVENLIENAIEDGLIGGLHGIVDGAVKPHGITPGHTSGIGRTPTIPGVM